MDFTTNTVSRITEYVEALNQKDQKALLDALERKVLMDEALRLNKSVKRNEISMQEICDTVNSVRAKRRHK